LHRPLFAGEYGLTVDPSFPHPCKHAATRTLNECTTAAVVKDLRGHFISRMPFRLRAVEMALPEKAILAYKYELSEAGDRDKCKAAVQRVGRAMAIDSRLSDADIQAEIDGYEKAKGPMPYPSPGTHARCSDSRKPLIPPSSNGAGNEGGTADAIDRC